MQFMKYGIFLVIGIAAQACGDDGDDGGSGDDDDTGGSTSSGGSSTGGSSTGGSSTGGSSTGGTSTGGTSTGGTSTGGTSTGGTSTGGTTGTGGSGGDCMAGETNLYESAECEDFFSCIYESACADAGAQQQVCIDTLKQLFTTTYPACVPNGDVASTCDSAKSDASLGGQYPECV